MLDLSLLVNGVAYGGWEAIRVTVTIMAGVNSFDLSLTDRWEAGGDVIPLVKGQSCQILVDGTPVITGYLWDVLHSYDDEHHTINVIGFSKAKDLVDCSTNGQQFSGRTLLQIATALCDPFGITVTLGADVGKALPTVAIRPGEKIFDFLNELSRIRGVRLISLPDGSIQFVQAGTLVSPTPLVFGDNIKRASALFSAESDFSSLSVAGQAAGSDTTYGDAVTTTAATVTNPAVRYRPLTVIADSPADAAGCKTRAQAEMNRLSGMGQAVAYTVQGWDNSDGLWTPNFLVPVFDPVLNIDDQLLIGQVTFSVDEHGGSIAVIEAMPSAAFDLQPLSIDEVPDQVKVKKHRSKRSAD